MSSSSRTRQAARLLAALLAIALALAVAPSATADPDPRRTTNLAEQPDPLRATLEQIVASGASGALALVDRGPRTRVLAVGQARLDPPLALRPRTKVRVGSLTKTFVATVALQLVARGRIGLDDTVEEWLPGLLPQGDQITLRMLLGHTSGLVEYGDEAFAIELLTDRTRVWRPAELVGRVAGKPLDFPPGTGWSYSNTGYVVAGMMLERATGRSLEGMVRWRLIRRLGLDATSFPTRARIRGYHARGYLPATPATGGQPEDVTEISPTAYWAAGAVVSNVFDVRRFYRALLRGRLLPRAQLAEMLAMTPVGAGAGYGLGLLRVDTPCGTVWGHNGQVPGYVTFALEDATGRRAAVVAVPTSPNTRIAALYVAAVGLAVCEMFGRTPPAGADAFGSVVPDLARWPAAG